MKVKYLRNIISKLNDDDEIFMVTSCDDNCIQVDDFENDIAPANSEGYENVYYLYSKSASEIIEKKLENS